VRDQVRDARLLARRHGFGGDVHRLVVSLRLQVNPHVVVVGLDPVRIAEVPDSAQGLLFAAFA